MTPQFFGREVEVTTEGKVRVPISFRLDDTEYKIVEIVAEWQDYGFGPGESRRKKRWWERRHRNYYHVKTTDDKIFEIYYDRGANMKHPEYRKWMLHRQL